jgi:hypothetical protein
MVMGLLEWFRGKPKEIDRDPNEHRYLRCVGRGYQGRHYGEQPPANVQYEQLSGDDTIWLNEDENW